MTVTAIAAGDVVYETEMAKDQAMRRRDVSADIPARKLLLLLPGEAGGRVWFPAKNACFR